MAISFAIFAPFFPLLHLIISAQLMGTKINHSGRMAYTTRNNNNTHPPQEQAPPTPSSTSVYSLYLYFGS
jgi:hypothetical protein